MNSRPFIGSLLKKYHKEKWVLSPKAVWKVHDSMGVLYKKFHVHSVEQKLEHSKNNIWFGLKSGIIFDRHEFLLIGDSMDSLHFNYEMKSGIKNHFLYFEGYTLYYMNEGKKCKITLSGGEVAFFQQYIDYCHEWLNPEPWDWEAIPDL